MLSRMLIGVLTVCCAAVASLPLRVAGAAELAPEQRREIESVIHDYLLQHPEVLIEALRAAEEKLKSDGGEKAKQALATRHNEIFDDPETPVGGNPKGDVTLVEFFDYRCPYCKQVQPRLIELLAGDPELRIAYKEYPILGAVSVTAARAALAAQRQGKYEAFHNTIIAASGQITDDTVYQVAKTVGLDLDRLKRDMASPQIDAALKANHALAEALDINGTPGLVVGDQIVPGAIELSSLKELVAEARRK
jgi:protein-disulfide isomerase